MLLVADAI